MLPSPATCLASRIATMAFLLVLPALAAAADGACTVMNRSNAVVVVVCPTNTSQDALRTAGLSACKGSTTCNAWIWDDAAKAPVKAPATDQDLPKAAAGTARAVWIQDAQQLMELRKVR